MIPVVIVDDEDVDRYIVKRRLAKTGEFNVIFEATDGDRFLDAYFSEELSEMSGHEPLFVLMDINMPRRNGFETVEELERRSREIGAPEPVVIMMFTSSDNPADRARAAELAAVKGYIVKPLDEIDLEEIKNTYPTRRAA